MAQHDIAVIGLAVMGQNLARNIARHGFKVAVYNRSAERTRELVTTHPDPNLTPCFDLETLVAALQPPRRLLLMVKAGEAVDRMIEQLQPLLAPGDILIDGGNSFFRDTERRATALAQAGIHFLGVGISGGEEGALHGPSIMPGGDRAAYAAVAPIFEAIAARAPDGTPCVAYLGPGGAGHYVKMVHNGIEYGDMQLIAESYDLLRRGAGLDAPALAEVFATWNQGELQSFLIEITADILRARDEESGQPLVDLILDTAGQKGTGKWTSQDSFELGVPIPTINAAVEMRMLSAQKEERVTAAQTLRGPAARPAHEPTALIEAVRAALYASKICAYAQGLALLRAASDERGYGLELATVARIWRAGCIIRARLLDEISAAFTAQPDLPNLLLAPAFAAAIAERDAAWRRAISAAIAQGIPVPALSSALHYYDAYRSERLPANLIQAQRDYFGAHTYARIDRPGLFHTNWSELVRRR
ncbi:NADP-dependent phosphogluconate dehydrogenase [Kallotenue papyrolyticum]|uniref:NADP-dependent phosphogluconate dehydrogenase n=1 Tax=Kallotenue papyrolyticum TaxID=1325125 RepID=UPI000492E5F9|nr:NADP-dependent phosphogluconate dehydrogenase [Kallotenue papyrolyticum]